MTRDTKFRWLPAACCLVVLGGLRGGPARGQEKPATTYDEWRLLEPAEEMLAYRAQLRDGVFDEGAKNFLTRTALPQLGLRKNRPTIDRVRRRMREVLCGDPGTDPKAAAAAMQVVADSMTALAREGEADIVTRVNAVLLIGELRGQGNKPWTPAVAPLVAMLGDEALPPAARIAAAAGLIRHVEADPAARSSDVGPAMLKIVAAPLAGIDPIAADWLRARALAALARMGPDAPNGTAAAAARVLLDAARPIDVRVRAAATLGQCIKAAGDTDVAAAVDAMRGLATSALTATKTRLERIDLAARLAGGGDGQPRPLPVPGSGDAAFPPPDGRAPIYRRDAWRLSTIADALATVDGAGGVARVAGPAAAAAGELATSLRERARDLDAQPDADSLEAALAALEGRDPARVDEADGASAEGAGER